jgi:hypothetical protein
VERIFPLRSSSRRDVSLSLWLAVLLIPFSSAVEFYREKQKRHGGDEAKFAQVMKLSPADGKSKQSPKYHKS